MVQLNQRDILEIIYEQLLYIYKKHNRIILHLPSGYMPVTLFNDNILGILFNNIMLGMVIFVTYVTLPSRVIIGGIFVVKGKRNS